jgi:hypothetical protein
MVDSYSFGIEIEIVAKPRNVQNGYGNREYYDKFARALRENGVSAQADELTRDHRHNPSQYTQGWWITRDGSLSPSSPKSNVHQVF